LIRKFEYKYSNRVTDAISSVFVALKNEIHEAMDELGEPRDKYHISVYPFSIERLDGEPVPDTLLLAIQEKLQTNQ